MSDKHFFRRNSPGAPLHPYFAPVPKTSPEYHLFRLESLFQALSDLWLTGTHKRHDSMELLTAYRRIQTITGLSGSNEAAPDCWFIMPFLMLGGMICNDAIHALQAGGDEADPPRQIPSPVESYVGQLRTLLVALHDFLEANAYQLNCPQGGQAQKELASLLGRHLPLNQNEIIHASFVTGGEIATTALATLQHSRQTA